MAVCTNFVDGVLTQVQSSITDCTGYVLVTAGEYNAFTEVFALDPVLIGASITFGVSIIVGSYYLVYPLEIAQRAINSIK